MQWQKGRLGEKKVEVTENKNGTEEDRGSTVSRESACHTRTGTQLDHQVLYKSLVWRCVLDLIPGRAEKLISGRQRPVEESLALEK